jgi:hypothetical protein
MSNFSQAAHDPNGRISLSASKSTEPGFFSLIERHRKTVLSSPFILAAALIVVHVLGSSDVRQVLDFMSPGRILGH